MWARATTHLRSPALACSYKCSIFYSTHIVYHLVVLAFLPSAFLFMAFVVFVAQIVIVVAYLRPALNLSSNFPCILGSRQWNYRHSIEIKLSLHLMWHILIICSTHKHTHAFIKSHKIYAFLVRFFSFWKKIRSCHPLRTVAGKLITLD